MLLFVFLLLHLNVTVLIRFNHQRTINMLYLIISNCRLFCLSRYHKAWMPSFILKRNHYLETFLLVVHINDKLPKTIKKNLGGLWRVLKGCQDEPRYAIGFVRRTSPRRVKTRPLNSASLRRASNAPIPLSIAHARTRTKNATLTSGPRPRSWPSEGLRSRARAARACP